MNGHLLALIADAVNVGNWQRQGKKNATKPKPIPRPGLDDGKSKYGGRAEPLEDIKGWLGW